jgi:alpha-tubulin suppressor-like RCC1 family protein
VAVHGGLTVEALSTGYSHTCSLTTAGTAYCWGDNSAGQLGYGLVAGGSWWSPVPVAGGLTFQAVSSGLYHSCGLTSTGAAYCWGTSTRGEIGDGASFFSTVPQPVAGGITFGAAAAR